MRTQHIFIVFIFLVAKVFYLMNGIMIVHLLGKEGGLMILGGSLLFVFGIFLFGLLVRKFYPRFIDYAWVFVVLSIMIAMFLFHPWGIIFLSAFSLYVMIDAETKMLRSLSANNNIPKVVMFLLTLLPVIFIYQFPQIDSSISVVFYITSSMFAFLASYSRRTYTDCHLDRGGNQAPLSLGLFFIAGSGLMYYLISHQDVDVMVGILAFALMFYAAGAFIVYTNLDNRLKERRP